jgi:hypothetical protein
MRPTFRTPEDMMPYPARLYLKPPDQTMVASNVGNFSWCPRKRNREESLDAPRSMIMTLSSVCFMRDSMSERIRYFSRSDRSATKTEY